MRWNDNNIYPSSRQTFFTWSEIFENHEEFIDKVVEVGGDSDNLQELYRILINKYVTSTTRYNMELPFIYAIRRELEVAWPMYLAQKKIVTDMIELDMEKLRTEMETIRETERIDTAISEGNTTGNTAGSDNRTDTGEQDTVNKDLSNVVNANTSPIVNADTIAIKDKSNIQTSDNKSGKVTSTNESTGTNNVTTSTVLEDNSTFDSEGLERYKQLGNDLEALTAKYEAIRRDYLVQIYRKMDPLFRVIL